MTSRAALILNIAEGFLPRLFDVQSDPERISQRRDAGHGQPSNEIGQCGLGMLTRASQWMLDGCFRPSSAPTSTCDARPSRREYTGAQTTVEKRESITVCRLITTNTRERFGSPRPGCRTR